MHASVIEILRRFVVFSLIVTMFLPLLGTGWAAAAAQEAESSSRPARSPAPEVSDEPAPSEPPPPSSEPPAEPPQPPNRILIIDLGPSAGPSPAEPSANPSDGADVGSPPSMHIFTLTPDAYDTLINVPLTVAPHQGVIINDAASVTGISPKVVLVHSGTGQPVIGDGSATGPTTQGGTVSLGEDGGFTYTPPTDFAGTDSFRYYVVGYSSGDWQTPVATSSPTTVTITVVGGQSEAPVAEEDFFRMPIVPEDVDGRSLTIPPADLLANDSNDGNRVMVIDIWDWPNDGVIEFDPSGNLVYTPNDGFYGSDTFTYVACLADDPDTCSEPTTVTIEVVEVPVVYAPTAVDDPGYTTTANRSLRVGPDAGVLLNDRAGNGGRLFAMLEADQPVPGNAGAGGPTAQGGSIYLFHYGAFIYTPPPNFIGTDTFQYYLNETGNTRSNVATVTITVLPDPNPALPVAAADSYSLGVIGGGVQPLTVGAPGVLGNDFDANGDNLTVQLQTGPAQGTVTLQPDGSFVYDPNPGFSGSDTFTYAACDGATPETCSAPATVTLTVRSLPIAVSDSYVIRQDGTLTVPAPGVLGNDHDALGADLVAGIASWEGDGSLTLNEDGSFSYVPPAGFTGFVTFDYVACTAGAPRTCSNPALVQIAVTEVAAPQANDDEYEVTAGQIVELADSDSPLTNDYDPNGEAIVATGLTHDAAPDIFCQAPNLTPDGVLTVQFCETYRGTVTLEYGIAKTVDASYRDTGTITFVVLPANPTNASPKPVADTYWVRPGGSIEIDPLANDFDPVGRGLIGQISVGDGPQHGTLSGDNYSVQDPESHSIFFGPITYTPEPGFVGTDTFTYQVCGPRRGDPCYDTGLGVVTIRVQETDPNPSVRPSVTASPSATSSPSASPSGAPSPSITPSASAVPSPSASAPPDGTVTLTIIVRGPDGSPLTPVCFAWEPDSGEASHACDFELTGGGIAVGAAQAATPGVVTFADLAPGSGVLSQELTAPGYLVAPPQRLTLAPGEDVEVVLSNQPVVTPEPSERPSPSASAAPTAVPSERPDVPTAPPSASGAPSAAPSAGASGGAPAVLALPNTGQGHPPASSGGNPSGLLAVGLLLAAALVAGAGWRYRPRRS